MSRRNHRWRISMASLALAACLSACSAEEAVKASGQAVQVSAGLWYVCSVMSSGQLWCWGLPWPPWGPFSLDPVGPTFVPGVDDASEVGIGEDYLCVRSVSGRVSCGGSNFYGELGLDMTIQEVVGFMPVPGIDDAKQLAVGDFHVCVLREGGRVTCWGKNIDVPQPPTDVTAIQDAVQLSASSTSSFTCAVRASGSAACWGMNEDGQLGDGTTEDSDVPRTVAGLEDVISISAGWDCACAVLASGSVACWGRLAFGTAGEDFSTVPVLVEGIENATRAAAGMIHACAILSSGEVACWRKEGMYGRWWIEASVPTVELSVTLGDTCAVTASGNVYCWGFDPHGFDGDGEEGPARASPGPPVPFPR